MAGTSTEVFSCTRLTATGLQTITSGFYTLGGIAFVGTATGGIQLFAGVTSSVSLTPMISFCATTSAVAGGFSPMFLRLPMVGSGTGLTVNVQASADPNLMLFWLPVGSP